MEKIQSTSKKIDVVFRVIQIAVTVAAVALLIGLAIIGAYFIFDLRPDQVGTGYEMLEFGFLELELTEAASPNPDRLLSVTAADFIMGFLLMLLAGLYFKSIRRILTPMKEGRPFHGTAAAELKRLAILTLIMGAVMNCTELVSQVLLVNCYDLKHLFLSDAIASVTVNYTFDLSFVLEAAILLLLSYIFHCGEELQQLSDETL